MFVKYLEQCLARSKCCVSIKTICTAAMTVIRTLLMKQKHRLDPKERGADDSAGPLEIGTVPEA